MNRRLIPFVIPALLMLAGPSIVHSQGKVRPDPGITCGASGIKPHELCFDVTDDGVARAETSSEVFYAIILKTAERCTLTEEERLRVQALFPSHKVFSMRFECGIEDNLTYSNVNTDFGFLAVYAGRTLKEAKARLAAIKATGQFPGANIRRMQAMRIHS